MDERIDAFLKDVQELFDLFSRTSSLMPAALITGANRGLGLEFTRQYLADGWQVFASCREPTSAKELQRLAQRTGGRLRLLQWMSPMRIASAQLPHRWVMPG